MSATRRAIWCRKTARTFNPMMATAGRVTVAEVEELVEPGTLDPDQIHTPGIYVQRIFEGTTYEKRIESAPHASGVEENTHALDPCDMAARAPRIEGRLLRQSRHRHPTLVANLHSARCRSHAAERERHAGHGPFPFEGDEDADLINAGKQTITQLASTSFFSSADSFAMIRGGHIDLSILGANAGRGKWRPRQLDDSRQDGQGMGGAMDLVAGVKRVVVVMNMRRATRRPAPMSASS